MWETTLMPPVDGHYLVSLKCLVAPTPAHGGQIISGTPKVGDEIVRIVPYKQEKGGWVLSERFEVVGWQPLPSKAVRG